MCEDVIRCVKTQEDVIRLIKTHEAFIILRLNVIDIVVCKLLIA